MSSELIIVGGFLGAGKTTSILSMAKHLLNSGKRVGIVTNDQGSELVDTSFLRAWGMSVLEVTGGCFCCNFTEFINKIQTLVGDEMPEVIIAEPVGSCTDLIATIFKPIELKYMSKLLMRPLSVVVDPRRIKRLMMEEDTGFHSEINYLFKKQLEEADIIVINKIDSLSKEEIKITEDFIKNESPDADIVCVSAKNELNMDRWLDTIYDIGSTRGLTLDIDYITYADAEARLGWLNLTAGLTSDKEVEMNCLIRKIINELKQEFVKECIEIAHLKIYGVSEDTWSKASITTIHEVPDFSKRADKSTLRWNLIINARVDAEPDQLRTVLEDVFYKIINGEGIIITDLNMECFKPGRPNPTYRLV